VQRINVPKQLLARYHRQLDLLADDVTPRLSELHEPLRQGDYADSSDLSFVFAREAASSRMQRLLLDLGRLMQAWLDLRETVRELRLQRCSSRRGI
jgi:hypothetical protein